MGGSHDENGKRKDTKNINSIERLLGSSGSDMDNLSFQLGPIDLNVKKGSFVGICGYVGSGKGFGVFVGVIFRGRCENHVNLLSKRKNHATGDNCWCADH